MKVFWICNTLIEEIALKQNIKLKKPESWISGLYDSFKTKGISIYYFFPSTTPISFKDDNCSFFSFSEKNDLRLSKKNISFFEEYLNNVKPDVVHIFGTELPHTLEVLKACEHLSLLDRCVVHIQGLVSFCGHHNENCLPQRVIKGKSFRDFLRFDSIRKQSKSFLKRGAFEIQSLKLAKNVIGRTDWDRSAVLSINPNLCYYHCGEILRKSFYSAVWSIDLCEKHSIFVSQSNYPLKGFHVVLQSFTKVKELFPDAKLYTTGRNILANDFNAKIRMSNYQNYLKSIIIKNGLQKSVVFMGYLSESEMCKRMLSSNVCVLSSFLENSPNSLAESMLLGVPSIASYVGGVPSLFRDRIDGHCYPPDEPELLAYWIIQYFQHPEMCVQQSRMSRERAAILFNKETIEDDCLKVYKDIVFKSQGGTS